MLFLAGMQPIDVGLAPDVVTIIGTKYIPGAFDYIIRASRVQEVQDQCLYLVLDTKSGDVLLHNGQRRLGIVAPHNKDKVTHLINAMTKKAGFEQVIVCKKSFITPQNEYSFTTASSFVVEPRFHVYERLARKFADKYRKKER